MIIKLLYLLLPVFFLTRCAHNVEQIIITVPERNIYQVTLIEKAVAYDLSVEKYHIPKPQNLIVSVRFDGKKINEYQDVGDAPIWTANYLASQAYRYSATKDDKALENIRNALAGINSIFEITGKRGFMSRYYFSADKSNRNDLFPGQSDYKNYMYIGDVSRDQYIGVMYGLGVAYELVPEKEKEIIRKLISDIIYYLEKNDWEIKNDDGSWKSGGVLNPNILKIFGIGSASHVLAFVKVFDMVDDENSRGKYQFYVNKYASKLGHVFQGMNIYYGYFANNLHYASFFNLIRLEQDVRLQKFYRGMFIKKMWNITKNHQNALFNYMYIVISDINDDMVLENTKKLLRQFSPPPRRNVRVENSQRKDITKTTSILGILRLKKNIIFAKNPIPISDRPPTDFLWQRSPFILDGGGDGSLQYPGIDFLLPYWMGRYYGFIGEDE